MKSPGRCLVIILLSLAATQMFESVKTAGSPKFSSVGTAQADPCAQERAELEKINKYELPARRRSIADKEIELDKTVEESISLDKKIEGAKQLGVPALVLDGYKNQSAELRKKIEALKKDLAKRKAEQPSFEARAAQLEERIGKGCPPSEDDWQKAIGKWRNQAGTLLFELVDLNKADREYHPNEPAKVEGYVRKVPPSWPTKIHAADLIFISEKVESHTLAGQWIQGPQKGDCPKMPLDYSTCHLQIDSSGETLTSKVETKQYYYPKCEWSDKVKLETFTYYRVK